MKMIATFLTLSLCFSAFAGDITNKDNNDQVSIQMSGEDELLLSGYEPLHGKVITLSNLKKVTDEYKENGSLFPVTKEVFSQGCHDRNGVKIKCSKWELINPFNWIFGAGMAVFYGTIDAVALPFRVVNRTVGNGKTRSNEAKGLIKAVFDEKNMVVDKESFERMVVLLSRSLK